MLYKNISVSRIYILYILYELPNFTYVLHTLYTWTTVDFAKVVKKFPVFIYYYTSKANNKAVQPSHYSGWLKVGGRLRQEFPLKLRYISSKLHVVTSHKTVIINTTTATWLITNISYSQKLKYLSVSFNTKSQVRNATC